jgi:hypothetical protein
MFPSAGLGLKLIVQGVGKKSPYTVPFASQVWALAKRQTILRFQDTFGIYTGYATSVIVSFFWLR